MKIPEQVKRLGLVIGVLVAATLIGRFVLIPKSLVSMDLHWANAVEREMAKPVKYAGATACQECHDDIVATKAKSFHKNLACEVCHGPALQHTEDPTSVKPPAPRDRKFCPVCHAYDPSRPTGFPQVNPTAHNPIKPCVTCHNPHDPTPPATPRECSGCHAQFERMKAASSHANLACTTCHRASEQHRKEPRTSALPSKPDSRAFCGQCHAKDAGRPDAPKVDLATHHRAYLCWQCHYPHLPEGRI